MPVIFHGRYHGLSRLHRTGEHFHRVIRGFCILHLFCTVQQAAAECIGPVSRLADAVSQLFTAILKFPGTFLNQSGPLA